VDDGVLRNHVDDDPGVVRSLKTGGDLRGEFEQALRGDWAALYLIPKLLAVDQLGDEKWCRSFDANVIHSEDVQMVERAGGPGFFEEASFPYRVGFRGHGQNLERNFALQARIARTIDFAHVAGTERPDDLVWAKPRRNRRLQGILKPSRT
jgi:hypothetical protein